MYLLYPSTIVVRGSLSSSGESTMAGGEISFFHALHNIGSECRALKVGVWKLSGCDV